VYVCVGGWVYVCARVWVCVWVCVGVAAGAHRKVAEGAIGGKVTHLDRLEHRVLPVPMPRTRPAALGESVYMCVCVAVCVHADLGRRRAREGQGRLLLLLLVHTAQRVSRGRVHASAVPRTDGPAARTWVVPVAAAAAASRGARACATNAAARPSTELGSASRRRASSAQLGTAVDGILQGTCCSRGRQFQPINCKSRSF
jgi:hypothetical protein